MIKQLTPTMTACNDDVLIIQQMKELGIYQEMQEKQKQNAGADTALFTPNGHVFIWHDAEGDSGYSHFYASNVAERLQVLVMVAAILQGSFKGTMH